MSTTGQQRILLVDDDGDVLAGLRRALRRQRERLVVETAGSAEAALEAMAREPADVVVSDMRMPGTDGVALLEQVQERWPATVRILLSGWADGAAVTRACSVAHRYLLKPCETETLRREVLQVCDAREMLPDAGLRRTFGALGSLPGLPATVALLASLPEDGDARTRAIEAAVKSDVALAVRVMQVTCSPSFSASRPPTGIHGALRLMGPGLLRDIAATLEPLDADETLPGAISSLERLGRHARVAARTMRIIAPDGSDDDALVTAALLHDAGRLAVLARLPARYLEVLQASTAAGVGIEEAERDNLGATHAQIGAYLLSLWGLPAPIVTAVGHHHDPGVLDGEDDDPVSLVATANLLAHQAEAAERARIALSRSFG